MFDRTRWSIAALFVFWLMAGVAGAAETAAPGVTNKPATAAVEIPLAEIAPRAEQTLRRIDELSKALEADSAIEAIARDLTPLSGRIDTWLKLNLLKIDRMTSVIDLNETGLGFQKFNSQLNSLQGRLERAVQRIGRAQKEVDDTLAAWKAAQTAAARKALPKLIQQRAGLVVEALEALDSRLKQRTTRLLSISSRIDAQQKQLVEFSRRIERKRQSVGHELFSLDAPPLWDALRDALSSESVLEQATPAWQSLLLELQFLAEDYRDQFTFYFIVLLSCAAAFFLARWRLLSEIQQDSSAWSELRLLQHPLASATIAFLIAATWLYPGATHEIALLVIFLTIPSVIFLGPALFPTQWRGSMYVLIGIFLLEFVRRLIPLSLPLDRLSLMGIDLSAAGFCSWLAVRRRQWFAELTGISRALRELLLVSAAVTAGAALANLVGNVDLANYLTTTTARLAYLGLIFYLCAAVVSALLSFLLRSRLARVSLLVSKNGPLLIQRCRSAAHVVAFGIWLVSCFFYLGMLGNLFSTGSDFLTRKWQIGAAEISVKDLLIFFLVFWASIYLSRFLRFVFREEVIPRVRLRRGVGGAIDMLSNYAILLLGFLLALATAGVDLSKVTLVLSGLGVGLGFGLQNLVSNFVSGLILAFEHPIQPGDVVEVGTTFGEVQRIGFRASVVRTFEGAEIIIPNGELVWGRVTNWTLSSPTRRIGIQVGAAYGTDPQRVLDILQQVARKNPKILQSPQPDALFDEFGDSSLNFTLRAWTRFEDFVKVRSELSVAIDGAFKEAGIQIPFPQRDLHIDWPKGLTAGGGKESGG